MLIGVCGKSGSGKTVICNELVNLGAYVIDADVVARNIMSGDILSEVKKAFPDCFDSGKLLRHKLGERVFSSADDLAVLNGITHPAVRRHIQKLIELNKENFEYIIVDAAVLIEAGMIDMFDCTVAVTAPDSVRLDRIMLRDNLRANQALLRIDAQMPDDFYIRNTDFHILNDGTKAPGCLAKELLKRSIEIVNRKNNI